MISKFLKFSFILFIISVVIGVISWYWGRASHPVKIAYQQVFKDFNGNNINEINRIRLQNPTSDTNIIWQDDNWRVVEEDGYPANIKILSFLVDFIQNGVYYRQMPFQEDGNDKYKLHESGENAGTLLTIYTQEKEYNLILGTTTEDYVYGYVRTPGEKEIWMVDKAFQAPKQRYSWLNQPILSYNNRDIASIEGDNWKIERPHMGGAFKYKDTDKDITPITDAFSKLYTTKVIKMSEIDESTYTKHNKLIIKDFEGLITEMNIYKKDEIYWANIKIFADNLPTIGVNDYIKNNSHRYDGWFFELVDFQGEVLLNYKP